MVRWARCQVPSKKVNRFFVFCCCCSRSASGCLESQRVWNQRRRRQRPSLDLCVCMCIKRRRSRSRAPRSTNRRRTDTRTNKRTVVGSMATGRQTGDRILTQQQQKKCQEESNQHSMLYRRRGAVRAHGWTDGRRHVLVAISLN